MTKVLLVGNSINRLSDGPAWDAVMSDLAAGAGISPARIEGKPLPIVYEAIVARAGRDENALKRDLANSMRSMRPNWAHRQLVGMGIPHILTTNYDYCLEAGINAKRSSANLARETTYSAFRRSRCGSLHIWHIHGEIDAPRTILLGLHQYAGYLQKLRGYFTASPKESPFRLGVPNFDFETGRFSWADLFLRDDIHIVGLTMDYVELPLWWLVTYKLRLARTDSLRGATHFYHFDAPGQTGDVAVRLDMLGDLGVDVHRVAVHSTEPNDWRIAHEEAFAQIAVA